MVYAIKAVHTRLNNLLRPPLYSIRLLLTAVNTSKSKHRLVYTDHMIDILFSGRMNRKNFILSQLALLVFTLLIVAFMFRGGLQTVTLDSVNTLIGLMLIGIPFQFICVFRRMHDLNQTGLWSFLVFVPYIALPFLIYVSYKKGDLVENLYGIPDTRGFIDAIRNT